MLSRLLPRPARPPAAPAAAPAPVGCACGHTVTVPRQALHQVLPCPACGRPIFVLPRSPLPPVEPAVAAPAAAPARAAPAARWRFWLVPVAAAAATLALIGVGLAVLWPFLGPPSATRVDAAAANAQALEYQIFEGRRALNEGAFQVASRLLTEAQTRAGYPQARLTAPQRRQLVRWQRQAALLAELLTEPLSAVVAHAEQLPEHEWRELFPERYRGYGVVFDCTVRRDAAGQVSADWEEAAGGQPVRIGFGGLTLLQRLPLAEPQRLLFGARLADVRRAEGGWRVEFEPDSGVLLTEPGVFAGTPLPPDPELLAVLKRQDDWLDWELP
jgi:hypothetical protein